MWENSLTIPNPYGVCVFGSALLRVVVDKALITAAVTRIEKQTSEAFLKAKQGAHAVADFLRKSGVEDFGMSRISLSQEYTVTSGERRSLGYKATIGFKIAIKALDRLEEIASAVVEAGANEIASIQFHTSNLKDLRMQARRQAIEAAKEKARVYAEAGGVTLGNIIHIQDANPQLLQTQLRSLFHVGGLEQPQRDLTEDDVAKQTLDPGAIEVTAAVLVAFDLNQKA